jgi:hypothetical protein
MGGHATVSKLLFHFLIHAQEYYDSRIYRPYGDQARLGLCNHREGHDIPDMALVRMTEWLKDLSGLVRCLGGDLDEGTKWWLECTHGFDGG